MAAKARGREHSSARLERYLQLCAESNMSVCNLTTPANYFHALRRQLKRNFRRPLVLMTPKSLLRHKLAVSKLSEMATGSGFKLVLPETDELLAPEAVKRVVICTGKVYYDLLAERRERGLKDVAIIRLEQIYPYPIKTPGDDAEAVPQRRGCLVPGRAGKHRGLELSGPPDRGDADAVRGGLEAAALRRP